MKEELEFALEFRELLLNTQPNNNYTENYYKQLYETIEPELIKLVYAKNKDLLDIANEKIKDILEQHYPRDDPNYRDKVIQSLKILYDKRSEYLKKVPTGLFGVWLEDYWTSANLALLILPLLGVAFFPTAGVGLLVYTAVTTGAAVYDFGRKSSEKWSEETNPEARELCENDQKALKDNYHDTDSFLPKNHPEKDSVKHIDRRAYGFYVLGFALAVIGLVSFLFPPMGIPVIALLLLSAVAIIATVVQSAFIKEKQSQLLAEIAHEQSTTPAELVILTNPPRQSQLLAEIAHEQSTTPAKSVILTNPVSPYPSDNEARSDKEKKDEEEEEGEGEGEHGPHSH